jgi:glycosyltransferase involved in cell wall biosynthesis
MHTEKPRVLHVIARFNVGGTARYLDNLLPVLTEHFETRLAVGHVQGHEIEDSSLEKINFKRIKHLGRKINFLQDFQAYFELRRLVKQFTPQIIHSHTFKAGLLTRLMFFRIPKVHTFHGHLIGDPEFSGLALQVIISIERRLAKLTRKLITVGEQVSRDLLQVGVGKINQYISIASESRDLQFLSRRDARAKLNIHTVTPLVLWMGRMAPVKNPSLALEVARLLPRFTFLMAGGGELFDKIKNQAPSNVQLLGWVDPANVIPAADIFLSTSLNEGIPYSLLEVLSAGVPLVAVKSGSIAEIIENGINGILTSQNPSEIAAQVSDLFSNPTQRLKTAKIVHNFTSQNSAEKKMLTAHLSLYREILSADEFKPHSSSSEAH